MPIITDKLLLEREIERCREKMIKMASTLSYSNALVVDVSTQLDELLNHYYQIK